MKVSVVFGDKLMQVKIKEGSTIEDALKKLGINTETVIVKRNSYITPIEEKVRDNDRIEIINVVSGG